MSTSAIEVLNRDLQDQSEKLKALESEYATRILEGEKAKQIVAAQKRRVDEVCEAIDVLNAHAKRQEVDA